MEILERNDGSPVNYVATGRECQVQLNAVKAVIECDYAQRQVDRRHNPHGEHAEEIYTILRPIPQELLQ